MLRGGGASPSPGAAMVWWGAGAAAARSVRARAVRWSCWHGAVLALLAMELASPCGPAGALRWAEGAAAVLAALALLSQIVRAARAPPPPQTPLSPAQLRLLGVRPDDIDSSFVSLSSSQSGPGSPIDPPWPEELSLSPLSAREPPSPPPSPPSPPSSPQTDLTADDMDLTRYYRMSTSGLSGSPPPYQTSCMEEEGGERGGAAGGAGGGAGDAALWRRLAVDPALLTQYSLNLRVWLTVTVLRPLARELQAGASGAGRLPAHLQPYVGGFADQAYCIGRVAALASGGALSGFRWRGGGPDWSRPRPTDPELVLHLLAAYLDSVLPGCPRPFSSRYLVAAGTEPRPPALVILRPQPLQLALSLSPDSGLLEPPPGPHNLFHAVLLFLAALSRSHPPCLGQVHLGPAGLNMLWIIGK